MFGPCTALHSGIRIKIYVKLKYKKNIYELHPLLFIYFFEINIRK